MVNTDQLTDWLKARAVHPDPIIHAIYIGLASRITRGDFDTDIASDQAFFCPTSTTPALAL